ncbi:MULTISPECIES: metal-dependent hydrolase [Pontibacillus]|uniref:Metal-dependent hydrolase n=1 Tax=Pontibacillus chungwhensis TaxID=265426 RepID=A0ABY8V4L1_9BACI|nr:MULTISPECIES: metal-dependent hydrolase [Pontibacillus]MCD5322241.1 metal-dependent hydrolase [Pontibacillus sp. HN14]WIF99535.1 metal-dependent hydrolase [Pontibacillus chungwhensis]
MTQLLVNHIPSTLMHITTAMVLTHLLFYKKEMSYKRRLLMVVSGAVIVLLIDVPKLMDIIFTHSLFFLPITSFIIALLVKKIFPFSLIRRWIGLGVVLLLAGIGVDYLGNGAHLFYPLHKQNVAYSVIKRDLWLLGGMMLLTLFSLSQKLYGWKWVWSGLLILVLLLGGKVYTKHQLEKTLDERYEEENIIRITTEPIPYVGYKWRFTLYSQDQITYGKAVGGDISELHE